jgi:hypothetical protein
MFEALEHRLSPADNEEPTLGLSGRKKTPKISSKFPIDTSGVFW